MDSHASGCGVDFGKQTRARCLWWQKEMLKAFKKKHLDPTKPYNQLTEGERDLIWNGEGKTEGIHEFFEYLEGKRYKMHVRVFLSRYRSPFPCTTCQGTRLRPEALLVKIHHCHIHEICSWPISDLQAWVQALPLEKFEEAIAKDLLKALQEKISFLLRVGLDYLTLNREMRTLSGGEAQRIHLATQLGSQLVGTQYVLDEPTIGLHPRDTAAMGTILHELAHRGNTVIVVEHDPQIIQQAEYIVELGPGSGDQGGEVVCAAPYRTFLKHPRSLTAQYLRGERAIPLPPKRRPGNGKILQLIGVREQNLKNLTVNIPLGTLICITGPSGSGKSTLVEATIYAALARLFKVATPPQPTLEGMTGAEHLRTICLIDQEPIGKTPRSNPITYIRAYQEIRTLFAQSPEARAHRLTPTHFSFNTGKGRCPRCQGNGYEKLEMYFLADLYVPCAECEGKRFKDKILQVQVKEHSIHDVLNLTVDHALEFFNTSCPSVLKGLQVLHHLGLGYLTLGQPATTLSGGETQRLKIARELANTPKRFSVKPSREGVLYILDEPTRGLHLEDITRLLTVLNQLVDEGNTVLVVEHHLDIIKCADWVIDLGPGGGESGGYIVAEGPPEAITQNSHSITGQYLYSLLV